MAGSRTLCRTCMPVPPAERVELYLPVKGPNLHDRCEISHPFTEISLKFHPVGPVRVVGRLVKHKVNHLTWWRALIAQSATAKPLKSERAWLVWGKKAHAGSQVTRLSSEHSAEVSNQLLYLLWQTQRSGGAAAVVGRDIIKLVYPEIGREFRAPEHR
eukprot:scaffold8357_cov114-Isochrysis_galbana.AAC.4